MKMASVRAWQCKSNEKNRVNLWGLFHTLKCSSRCRRPTKTGLVPAESANMPLGKELSQTTRRDAVRVHGGGFK